MKIYAKFRGLCVFKLRNQVTENFHIAITICSL